MLFDIFGDNPSFHDTEIKKICYRNEKVEIIIDTKGYFETLSIFNKKHSDIDDAMVKFIFDGV